MSAALPIYLMEGFDHLSSAQITGIKNWTFTQTGAATMVLQVTTGRFGGQAAHLIMTSSGTSAGNLRKVINFPAGAITGGWALGFSFRMFSNATAMEVGRVETSANGRVCGVNYSGSVLQILNAAGTAVVSGTTAIQAGTWYQVVLVGSTVSTTATTTLYLNGVQEATAASVNIGSTAINRCAFFAATAIQNAYLDIDDVFVGNAGVNPGDVRVETLRPNTDGTTIQWTPLSSTNASNVDDVASHDTDTTYNMTNGVGNIDTFHLTTSSLTSGTIYAIQTNIIARKDETTTRQIADVIYNGVTNTAGTTTGGLTTGYLHYPQIHNQDPSSNDWTITTLNADEFGYKEIA